MPIIARRNSPLRILLLALVVGGGVFALAGGSGSGRLEPARASVVPSIATPASYDEALALIDLRLTANIAAADERGDEWAILEELAGTYLKRARLSGSFDDYASAQAALDRAFAVAVPGTGPHMMQAVLDFTMHRLARAEAQLALIDGYAVAPDWDIQAEMMAMRGDIAFYRGDYRAALAGYGEAAGMEDGSGANFRLAVYHARTGRPDLAERYFDRAERSVRLPTPQLRSNLELQRGTIDLDRGRYPEALAHFRRADSIFPGHWLIKEHIAETLALLGEVAAATTLYQDIVRRSGHPEFMDALADIEAARGNIARADAWTRRARRAWRQRLALFPEAAYGHALAHYLKHGDPAETLTMAERNHAARPHGEALVLLAEAQLRAGKLGDAKTTVEKVMASEWRTADVARVAALVDTAAGTQPPPATHPIRSGR